MWKKKHMKVLFANKSYTRRKIDIYKSWLIVWLTACLTIFSTLQNFRFQMEYHKKNFWTRFQSLMWLHLPTPIIFHNNYEIHGTHKTEWRRKKNELSSLWNMMIFLRKKNKNDSDASQLSIWHATLNGNTFISKPNWWKVNSVKIITEETVRNEENKTKKKNIKYERERETDRAKGEKNKYKKPHTKKNWESTTAHNF